MTVKVLTVSLNSLISSAGLFQQTPVTCSIKEILPFWVHREITCYRCYLHQEVGTDAEIDCYSLKIKKLQTVVVGTYIHIKAVVLTQDRQRHPTDQQALSRDFSSFILSMFCKPSLNFWAASISFICSIHFFTLVYHSVELRNVCPGSCTTHWASAFPAPYKQHGCRDYDYSK